MSGVIRVPFQLRLSDSKFVLSRLKRRSIFVTAIGAFEQVCLAVTHFALTVMVARILGIDALGHFTFLYALIVLASMAHGAVLGQGIGVSPSLVGAVERRGLQAILIPTACLAVTLALVVQPLALAMSEHALSGAPFLSALVGSLFFWTARSYFYKLYSPIEALSLTLIYSVGTLLSFFILPLAVQSSDFGDSYKRPLVAIAIGASSALAFAIALWSRSRYRLALLRGRQWLRNPDTHQVWVDVLQYGKWSLPATGLIWLATNGYYIVLPIFGHNQGAAGLRAALMVMLPLDTLIAGAVAALLPMLADQVRQNGFRSIQRVIHGVAGLAAGAGLVLGIVLLTNSNLVMRTVYGPAFVEYSPLLQITAILPCLLAASAVYRTGLRATGRSSSVFGVYAIAMIPVGLTVMAVFGRLGALYAAFGVVVTQVLILIAFLWSARRISREA